MVERTKLEAKLVANRNIFGLFKGLNFAFSSNHDLYNSLLNQTKVVYLNTKPTEVGMAKESRSLCLPDPNGLGLKFF